jgi:hypothetical protein
VTSASAETTVARPEQAFAQTVGCRPLRVWNAEAAGGGLVRDLSERNRVAARVAGRGTRASTTGLASRPIERDVVDAGRFTAALLLAGKNAPLMSSTPGEVANHGRRVGAGFGAGRERAKRLPRSLNAGAPPIRSFVRRSTSTSHGRDHPARFTLVFGARSIDSEELGLAARSRSTSSRTRRTPASCGAILCAWRRSCVLSLLGPARERSRSPHAAMISLIRGCRAGALADHNDVGRAGKGRGQVVNAAVPSA